MNYVFVSILQYPHPPPLFARCNMGEGAEKLGLSRYVIVKMPLPLPLIVTMMAM